MRHIRIYHTLPQEALNVRIAVFVDEQGFFDEFDDADNIAAHLVLFDNETPVGTCRVFPAAESGRYILGRLAVLKAYRGQQCGSHLLTAAEDYVRSVGGTILTLHSQFQAQAFYKARGYAPYGDVEDEQGCPHIWMKKEW